MADSVIKYITINDILYRIEEYTYRGYAGSYHVGSSSTRVPEKDVERIKKNLKEQEKSDEV